LPRSILGWGARACPAKRNTSDQHDAFAVVEWLRRVEIAGTLASLLDPALPNDERAVAAVEGRILGVGGQMKAPADS